MRRTGLIRSLDGLIPALLAARRLTQATTSNRGGMLVTVTGLDDDGILRQARWSLLAEQGDGPRVPTLAAAAALRALMRGALEAGARPAAGALTLREIEAELAPYAITTHIESKAHGPALLQRAFLLEPQGDERFIQTAREVIGTYARSSTTLPGAS